jgi:hypothetical protein
MQYSIKKLFNYIKLNDILHIFLAVFVLPWALLTKIFVRDFWLICEDKNEARDNGYWLFKWIRENHPKQKVAYAINKHSPDYERVKGLGKIIGYSTISHWFWYIVADKNISSQKGGKPNAAVCYLFEVVFKMRKNNRVFLQHGVTKDRAEWLFFKNTNFRLFITASSKEHEFILKYFGYPENHVSLCGFTRFDALHQAKTDKDLILVMPTWRNWLGRDSHENSGLDFTQTQFFKEWNGFLNDSKLIELLTKYQKRLLFYPHRNMQKFLQYFTSHSDRIEIADWKKYNIQEVLKSAVLMITDYSSVFFDFSYMRKPVIFFQFDEKEFREKQYAEGYLDYHNTVLGKWTNSREETYALLENEFQGGCALKSEDMVKEFFPLWDEQNCKRNYEAIQKI